MKQKVEPEPELSYYLTLCVFRQHCLLTPLYLHGESAGVQRVLRAVGGWAAPVEVQLQGVIQTWEAPTAHRHPTAHRQHHCTEEQGLYFTKDKSCSFSIQG